MLNKTKLLTYTLSVAFIFAVAGMATLHAGHHGGKNKMEMMDTDGDGAVSKEEYMSHKEQRFMMKDENGDGVLSDEEMKKHCKHKGKGKPEKE